MLELARHRCSARRWAEFQLGNATELPAEDGSFDAAVSVQVFEYVADVEAALAETYRVLSPGGRAVVVSTDWDSILWHSGNRDRMRRVLAAFDEHCAYSNLPRMLGPKLRRAGFELLEQSVVAQFNPSYDANTYSYHLIQLISSFVAGRKGVTGEEADEWANELHQLGQRGARQSNGANVAPSARQWPSTTAGAVSVTGSLIVMWKSSRVWSAPSAKRSTISTRSLCAVPALSTYGQSMRVVVTTSAPSSHLPTE